MTLLLDASEDRVLDLMNGCFALWCARDGLGEALDGYIRSAYGRKGDPRDGRDVRSPTSRTRIC